MRVNAAALAVNVDDVEATSAFLVGHFGFREQRSADGYASLVHPDLELEVIALRRGLELLPDYLRDEAAAGLMLALTVDDVEVEEARLRAAGVPIAMPLRVDPWGERSLQVRAPSGLVVQLVDWRGAA